MPDSFLHTAHATAPITVVKGHFEGLTHQTLSGATLGTSESSLWQHYLTDYLKVPPHYHLHEETIVVLSGAVRFFVGVRAEEWQEGTDPLEGAQTVDCGPEATFVVPTNVIHAYDTIGVPTRILIFMPDPHATTLLPGGEPLPLPWQV